MKLKAAFTAVVGLVLLLTPLTGAAQTTASAGIGPLSDDPAWTGEGVLANDMFGHSVAAAGDVNGDGYSDVIVSAPGASNDQDWEGQAYVYLGTADGVAASPVWVGESDQAYACFGCAVGTAGDVNGDGYDDVIVGASSSQGDLNEGGRAYVYLGSASGLANSPAWVAESDQAGATFGFSVGTAGDVNGDGYSDVIVGARAYSGTYPFSGQAYVYLGSASGLASSPAWMADDYPFEGFGWSVGTAGDVNGDGYSDVIVGVPEDDDDDQIWVGQAYVYLGSATGLAADPTWVVGSDQAYSISGWSVGTAGDVNGDGYSDVIVGAPVNSDSSEGRAYMYLGSVTGLAPSPAWVAEGDELYAWFGTSLGTAGDVNGDGYSDVIIGAPYYDDGEVTNEGRAYVYLGAPYHCAYLPIVTWQQGNPD